MNNKPLKNISVPRELFNRMREAYQKWEKFSDEFEDFLLSSDEEFIKRMKKARKEHLKGNLRDLNKLRQELDK